jgi:hypothetical protein
MTVMMTFTNRNNDARPPPHQQPTQTTFLFSRQAYHYPPGSAFPCTMEANVQRRTCGAGMEPCDVKIRNSSATHIAESALALIKRHDPDARVRHTMLCQLHSTRMQDEKSCMFFYVGTLVCTDYCLLRKYLLCRKPSAHTPG